MPVAGESCFLYFQRVNCQHSLLAHVRRNAWLFMQTVFESLIGASVGWAVRSCVWSSCEQPGEIERSRERRTTGTKEQDRIAE